MKFGIDLAECFLDKNVSKQNVKSYVHPAET